MKIKQFQQHLRNKKIDLAFFVHPDVTLRYFTQAAPSYGLLIVKQRSATLYASKLDKVTTKNVIVKTLPQNWEKRLAHNSVKKIGINKESLTVSLLEKLKKMFPKAKFTDISKELFKLRKIKTVTEIQIIRKACHLTSTAFLSLIKELPQKTLMTEQDVASFLERNIQQKGGSLAFPTIVAFNKNAAIPHHQTSSKRLSRGLLLLDFGACYKGYCADMTRVICLGKATKKEKEMYSLLLETQEKVIHSIEKGKKYQHLDNFTRKQLGKYSSYFIHSLGHGIGVEVHESPHLSPEGKGQVDKGNIFTIEPGLYFPNKFGLRIEDTVLFSGKVEVLTKAPKNLIELDWS